MWNIIGGAIIGVWIARFFFYVALPGALIFALAKTWSDNPVIGTILLVVGAAAFFWIKARLRQRPE